MDIRDELLYDVRNDSLEEDIRMEELIEIERIETEEMKQDSVNQLLIKELGSETRSLLERLDAEERKAFLEEVRGGKYSLDEIRRKLKDKIR